MKAFIKSHWWQVVAAVILLTAVGLRFYQLGSIPASLYWDEVAMLVDAKTVSQTGKDMHGLPWYHLIYPSYGDYKLPVYIWLASISVKIFGVSNFALRLPSAVAGVMTVWMAGLLGYQLTRRRSVQLASMLMVTIAPWSIMFSRTGFEGHVAQMLVGLSLLLLMKAKKHNFLIVLSAIMGILATYTYFSVRFVWPIVYLGTVIFYIAPQHIQLDSVADIKKPQIRKLLITLCFKYCLLPLMIFAAGLLLMMSNQFYHDSETFRFSTDSVLAGQNYPLISNQYRELAGNTNVDRLLFHRSWLMIRQFGENVFDHLSLNYLFLTGDSNLRHGTRHYGLFVLPVILAWGTGLITLFYQKRRVFGMLLIWWLVALVPASVPETTPHALRSLNALLPLSIISGYGLAWIWQKSRRLAVGFLAILIVFSTQFMVFYLTQYPAQSESAWQGQYQQMAEVIISHQDEVDSVWTGNIDERFYLWLFAYGPYSSQEIQATATENFQPDQFQNIYFSDYDWRRRDPLKYGIMIAGNENTVRNQLNKQGSSIVVTQQYQFATEDNLKSYMVVIVKERDEK